MIKHIKTFLRTAVWNADGMGSTKEVLSDRGDLSTITDSNRTIVTMGIIVARLLVVLKLDIYNIVSLLHCNSFLIKQRDFLCVLILTIHISINTLQIKICSSYIKLCNT